MIKQTADENSTKQAFVLAFEVLFCVKAFFFLNFVLAN